ncbi:NADP-dependent oxidoreductase [Rhodopirellula europaea]|jgi:NADPH-dependent curcumin reductase CurA|uniref:Alcohol dehydrogenase, zinc-containing n=1 Tax=Rhodopirellula europaea SH398 TaxID=1263868 RepID=M5SC30_9BACT|nr:NADP-dependent oxidoreductase [Rhodopirellula europaea]EMI23689.1 alcohol dehydrogenase, zinc-containing [Rhodopirellula europaea SH398]
MSTATSKAVQSKQIELVSRPDGMPQQSNFEMRTAEVGPIKDGEILVKNQWMSVDPYMRGRMKDTDSYVPPFQIDEPLEGGCIGEVIQSQNSDFKEGDMVLGNLGWREYWSSNGEGVTKIDPNIAPPQAFLGALGMTGMTAWVGLHKIAQLKEGSTVFVSAASGAVGSIVCQLAKAMDCRVIGSAGKQEKIQWLMDKTGSDAVINYKEVDNLSEELAKHAPDGIDVYFDNVGSDHLEAAIDNMNDFGCCVECGMIATYNATEAPAAPRNMFKVIAKRLRIQGFIVRDHMDSKDEFVSDMATLIQQDKVVWEESVTDGIENAPDAFIGLFEGDNLGKQLVRLN